MTERLYDQDSHIRRFSAVVQACLPAGDGWEISLDRTAFFPGGGGQEPDTGVMGGVRVTGGREDGDGTVWHRTDGPLEPGTAVDCAIDWPVRFRRMQHHSGEHILSGLTCAAHHCNNVGFHMDPDGVVIDFDVFLSREQLAELERRANEAICRDLPVSVEYPDGETLAELDYRSKLELTERVRIVTIPGVDCCACCAPHVRRTGEVGQLRIVDAEKHKGGVRLRVLCGAAADEDTRVKLENVAAISALLSAKQPETAAAVQRLLEERDALKQTVNALKNRLVELQLAALSPTEGNLCLFPEGFDPIQCRQLADSAAELCSGVCAVFSGSDGEGYQYVMASQTADMQAVAKAFNAALQGRGGGRGAMVQGAVRATRAAIEAYFHQ